jgi:hypothetical protein
MAWARFWPSTRNATMLETGLFDQSTGSDVERRFKQALYLIQQCLRLTQIFKGLTSVRVLPDLEQHKKVWSLNFFIGGEADRSVPSAESRQLLNELPATVLLGRQELYIGHNELLCVSLSPPMCRKGQQREGEQGQ